MLVIHDLGVYLVIGGKLLDNIVPGQPMSSVFASKESLRCCPVMKLIFTRFIRAILCLPPCFQKIEPFLSPRVEDGPETIYL